MTYCLFTTASLVLTGAMLACGMSFFSPFWLQNLKSTEPETTNTTYLLSSAGGGGAGYVPWTGNYSRGLWAQCGARCQWFWESEFLLQTNLFTPLSKLFLKYYDVCRHIITTCHFLISFFY